MVQDLFILRHQYHLESAFLSFRLITSKQIFSFQLEARCSKQGIYIDNFMIFHTLQSGQTALILAVHCGSEEVINLLREASASTDIQGKVWFPIVMFMICHDYNYYEKHSNNRNTFYTNDAVD